MSRRLLAIMRTRRLWCASQALLVVVAAPLLAGCDGSDASLVPSDDDFARQVEQALVDAREAGASGAQIDELETALADREVTLEAARAAADRAIACFTAAGLEPEPVESVRPNGLAIPGYTVGPGDLSEDAALAVMDACQRSEDFWVTMLYQLQPSSVEINMAFIEQQEPLIRQCLEAHGSPPDPDATPFEVVDQAFRQAETLGVQCAAEAGVVNY